MRIVPDDEDGAQPPPPVAEFSLLIGLEIFAHDELELASEEPRRNALHIIGKVIALARDREVIPRMVDGVVVIGVSTGQAPARHAHAALAIDVELTGGDGGRVGDIIREAQTASSADIIREDGTTWVAHFVKLMAGVCE